MNPVKAKTILKMKAWTWGDEPEKWNYINLKSRRKIKKKKGVKFVYKAEVIEWHRTGYKMFEKEISFSTIRNLYQNKQINKIQKVNTDWDILKAKVFLEDSIKGVK